MAEEFDTLTYALIWIGAGLFTVLYGALTALAYRFFGKKDHETRQDIPR